MSIFAGLAGIVFMAAFTLLPLHWISVGAPWVTLAVAFVAIPLIDALVGFQHAWLPLNLQLHSGHHANMRRSYEQLRSVPSAPQLPAGYPAMTLLALVPPAWFAVMDRRLPA